MPTRKGLQKHASMHGCIIMHPSYVRQARRTIIIGRAIILDGSGFTRDFGTRCPRLIELLAQISVVTLKPSACSTILARLIGSRCILFGLGNMVLLPFQGILVVGGERGTTGDDRQLFGTSFPTGSPVYLAVLVHLWS